MTHPRSALAATAVAASLAGFAAIAPSPASAAVVRGCTSRGAACFYDLPGWRGTVEAVGCRGLQRSRASRSFQRLRKRVGSVINGCPFTISLWGTVPPGGEGGQYGLNRYQPVYSGQWVYALGGWRRFDNFASGVFAGTDARGVVGLPIP